MTRNLLSEMPRSQHSSELTDTAKSRTAIEGKLQVKKKYSIGGCMS